MKLYPRHIAAFIYLLLSFFMASSWISMLGAAGEAGSFLTYLFSTQNSNQEFFVSLVIATTLTILMAISFLIEKANLGLFVVISIALLVWALWWSNETFIFGYSFASLLTVLSRLKPEYHF